MNFFTENFKFSDQDQESDQKFQNEESRLEVYVKRRVKWRFSVPLCENHCQMRLEKVCVAKDILI